PGVRPGAVQLPPGHGRRGHRLLYAVTGSDVPGPPSGTRTGPQATSWAASQRALYDGIAPHYDDAIPHHVAAHYREKRVAPVRRLPPPGGLVLDVGCGTGTLAAAIRAGGYGVVGLDASLGMLTEMGAGGRGRPVGGFGERLPFATGAFDLAITVATLHHLPAPRP